MSNITKNGVCYDLPSSPYCVDIMGVTFCFSTQRNKEKFIEQRNVRIKGVASSLYRRFHINIDSTYIALIQLYMIIEHRGFALYINDYLVNDVDDIDILCALSMNGLSDVQY